MSADNQQERLSASEAYRWFLAGLIEGEGSVCVSIKEHPTSKFGYYVDPEFFLYQHKNYIQMLEDAKKFFGTGRIFPKPGNRQVMVYAISCRRSIYEKVLPFLNRYMKFSCRKRIYITFAEIVRAMEEKKQHRNAKGLVALVRKAYSMNLVAKGKGRKRRLKEVEDRILRGHTSEATL